MTKTILPAEAGGTEITRFNALQHGILSRYTVLPWEDEVEYQRLLTALAKEHTPRGPIPLKHWILSPKFRHLPQCPS